MVSENDMVRQMMAYKAKREGSHSIAQSYIDLVKEFEDEEDEEEQGTIHNDVRRIC